MCIICYDRAGPDHEWILGDGYLTILIFEVALSNTFGRVPGAFSIKIQRAEGGSVPDRALTLIFPKTVYQSFRTII